MDTVGDTEGTLDLELLRARDARRRAERLRDDYERLQQLRRETHVLCLAVHDRVTSTSWRSRSIERNPHLADLIAASRRAFAAAVGRSPDIDNAKELIMERTGCTPDEAFAILCRVSQRRNQRVAVVARELVERRGDQQPITGRPR
jgi:hypothetical protein